MKISASRALLFIAISLLAAPSLAAEVPAQEALSVQVLPARRTPVHLWPIQRGCAPDPTATAAVARRLSADLRLQLRRLAVPRDARHLGCIGAGCAALLDGAGCEKRSGLLIGGEIDEAPCDASDPRLAGCHGQPVARLRVFRIDLESNQPGRGDYRYAVCPERRCGPEGRSIEETLAQLAEELVAASSLPAVLPAPRSQPAPDEQCLSAAVPPVSPPPPPVSKSVDINKAILFAYYTQYKNINTTNDKTSPHPARAQAEAEARTRALRFAEGVTPPPGLEYAAPTVNGKYTLLPGEALIGNAARTAALQGFLSTPPAAAAYDRIRRAPLAQRILIALVFDHETRSLGVHVLEPGQSLRTLPTPAACEGAASESAACITAVLTAVVAPESSAVASSSSSASSSSASPSSASPPGRPLGCIPFAERSCAAWACPAAPVIVVAPPAAAPPPAEPHPLKWTTRLLYTALGVSLATAGVLTIVDSANSPAALMDAQGNTATITGLLRPAVWTAWGLSVALAVPTAISVVESGRAKREALLKLPPPAPPPPPPRCAIADDSL